MGGVRLKHKRSYNPFKWASRFGREVLNSFMSFNHSIWWVNFIINALWLTICSWLPKLLEWGIVKAIRCIIFTYSFEYFNKWLMMQPRHRKNRNIIGRWMSLTCWNLNVNLNLMPSILHYTVCSFLRTLNSRAFACWSGGIFKACIKLGSLFANIKSTKSSFLKLSDLRKLTSLTISLMDFIAEPDHIQFIKPKTVEFANGA